MGLLRLNHLRAPDEIDLVVFAGRVGPELGGRLRVGKGYLNGLTRTQCHTVGGRNIATAQVASSGIVVPRLKDQGPGVSFVGSLDRGPAAVTMIVVEMAILFPR